MRMKKAVKGKADTMNVRMKKAMITEAGQGNRATRNAGGRERGTQVAGTSLAQVAGSIGPRWVLANSSFRNAQTTFSPCSKLAELAKAHLPLVMFAGSHHEEVAGSLPLTVRLSAGPYTSCSNSPRSHESLLGLLLAHRVAILTPPTLFSFGRGGACSGRSLFPRRPLKASLPLDAPGPILASTRPRSARPTPCPLPREGEHCRAHAVPVLIVHHRHHHVMSTALHRPAIIDPHRPSSSHAVPHPHSSLITTEVTNV